ncbi:MAG: PAS domain S-box protein, partial [Methylocella sp.]
MLAEKAQGGMPGFCCEPRLTRQDIAAILAVLPAGVASQMPIVAMRGNAAHPDRLVLASESLLHLCGAKNLDGLFRFLSAGEGGCSQRLADVAANLSLDAAPAVETLHFRIGGATRTVTFLCRRAGAGREPALFAAAVLDVFDRWGETGPLVAHAESSAGRGGAGQRNESTEPGPPKAARPTARLSAGSSRESLEKELARQKAEFRELSAILDTAMDGIAVLDSQGLILSLNRSGEALFGYDQNEVTGAHFTSLIAPESQVLANAYFEGLKSQGAASLLNRGREVTGLARQGGTIPVFMTLGRIGESASAGEQRAARFCALLRDLTHWKNVERELEEARKDAERANALKSDLLAR